MPRTLLVQALLLALLSAPQPGEAAELRLGATLPLSGPEAKTGARFRDGYQLAIDEANARGGLRVGTQRLTVKLDLRDDETNPEKASRLVQELVETGGAQLLLGSYSTSVIEAQSAAAEKLKVPYINGGGAATGIYRRGFRYVFGLLAPVEQLSDTLLRWVSVELDKKHLEAPVRVALAWENTAHGRDFRAGVAAFVERTPARRAGFKLVLDQSFELNQPDYKTLLGQVDKAKADVLLVDAHLPDYIAMQNQYVALGLCHRVLSYGARGPEKDALAALPPGATDGILSSVWWSPQLGTKGPARQFVESFKARHSRAPEWTEALAFETARTLFTAVERAGSIERSRVRDALAAFSTDDSIVPGGYLSFPEAYGGQAHYLFVVQQNQGAGAAPIIYPAVAATGTGTLRKCPEPP